MIDGPLALNVLMAASRSSEGVRVRDLVDAVVRFDGRPRNVARVQVSRIARQLWRAGLVELHGRGGTMTECVVERHEIAARAFAKPEWFYRFAVALRGDDPYGSASACATAKARTAQVDPRLHVDRITVTDRGLARLAAAFGGNEISPPAGASDDGDDGGG